MNIVIKLPNDIKGKVLSFPFLQTLEKQLKRNLEEDEQLTFHLIGMKDSIDVLNLLPFNAYYHELEKDDVKSIFTMHRACMNLKIDRPDIFISTTESFVDASIGKNLGCETKIGFALGKNSWFLNKKISLLSGRHRSEQIYELMKPLLEETPDIPNVYSRNVDPIFADWNINPYTVINLKLVDGELESDWADLSELLVNKNFVFMCSDLPEEEQKDKLEEFVKGLPQKNTYKTFEYNSNINFAKLISYCTCFVSSDSPLVNIAAYCGAHIFFINYNEKMNQTGPQYFIGDVRNFALSDPTYKQGNGPNYGKVIDEVYEYIDEKTKVETE